MAKPQNHEELYAHILTYSASEHCGNKALLQTIRELMYVFKKAQISYREKDNKLFHSLFTPEINFDIVNELCSHLHNVLAYLDEKYDEDLKRPSYDDCLGHINKIIEIREEHFKGENWSTLTVLLQCVGVITFISSIVTLCTTLPPLIPIGLLVLSMLSISGGMFCEKQGFNYSVASKLSFFEPKNLSPLRDSDCIEHKIVSNEYNNLGAVF